MSSFMVLRASSSRRTITTIPKLEHVGDSGESSQRYRNQNPSPIHHNVHSQRPFSSSSRLRAESTSSFDQKRQQYNKNTIRTTPEKRRILEALNRRTGHKVEVLNSLTYAPYKPDWYLLNPRKYSNIWRHWKHRLVRNTYSRDSATLAEDKGILEPSGWLADLPEVLPIYHNDGVKAQEWRVKTENAHHPLSAMTQSFTFAFVHSWRYWARWEAFAHPIKMWTRFREDHLRWRMNAGQPFDKQTTGRTALFVDTRYPDEIERVTDVWKRFNEAQAKRDTRNVDKFSIGGAHRAAQILMSSNRVIDWKTTREYNPPRFLWMRTGAPDDQKDRAFIQFAMQFDTEQSVTFVDPIPRKGITQSYPRSPSEKVEGWKIDEYRQRLSEERYHSDIEKSQKVQSEVLFPEGKEIVSRDATEGFQQHTKSSRVIENVVFMYDSQNQLRPDSPPTWKVLDHIELTQPHYTMESEVWEEIQEKTLQRDKEMGLPPVAVHHVRQRTWNKIQKEKEKKGITEEEPEEEDPIKARRVLAAKRVQAWRKTDEQSRRERALLAMSNPEDPHREDYRIRLGLARKTRQGDVLANLDKVAEVKASLVEAAKVDAGRDSDQGDGEERKGSGGSESKWDRKRDTLTVAAEIGSDVVLNSH